MKTTLFSVFSSLFIIATTSYAAKADIEFVTSNTTTQVATAAGTQRTNGTQKSANSLGEITNNSFASVSETEALLGAGGIASAEIIVDPTNLKDMFVFMQVAATTLPEFQQGTFAEASVQYFFSNPVEIEIERGIDQGDTRFFIDSIQTELKANPSTFFVQPGLHVFEIEVVPGKNQGDVTNPNFSIRIFGLDNNPENTSPPAPTPTEPDPQTPPSTFANTVIIDLVDGIDEISVRVSKKNKLEQNENLNKIRDNIALLSDAINENAFSATGSDLETLVDLNNSLSKTVKTIGRAKRKKSRRLAKKKLAKTIALIRDIIS